MEDVMGIEEACTYLKLAKPTLYKLVRAGSVPAFKLGSVWRFRKESLDDWMAQRIKEGTAQRSSVRKKPSARQ